MKTSANIKEIFTSIQGEGLYIGFNQLFIRFSGCNLHCTYCDTNHEDDAICYTPLSLYEEISRFDAEKIHSVSLTGGEPLLHTGFLLEFLPMVKQKIYLETNGTLPEAMAKTAKYIDIAAVDIKLNSVSNQGNLFATHNKFIEIAKKNNVETFVKVVFDGTLTGDEIKKCAEICRNNDVPLVLQPVMLDNKLTLSEIELNDILNEFLNYYQNVRLIPQVHKFLNIR